jgi:hypothetical protein
MLNSKPPWYAGHLTRENLKKIATWLAVIAFFLWIVWPDSREKKLVREVNARASALIENYPSLTNEQIVSELEAIRDMTEEPEPPEHDDPF